MKSEELCLEKVLKIEYIDPEFKDLLLEGHEIYKGNHLIHKKKAADKRKENSKKKGNNKKKLN